MADSDLDRAIERLRQMSRNNTPGRPWFEMKAKNGERKATVRIFDEIAWWGTDAASFADELDALDVDEIDLRLNSPGGNAWDGIAIYNSLRAHPAKITVNVDGMAASAASLVAMAGDRVVMHRGTQMMIHDAGGFAMGNAADMRKMADVLDTISDSAAEIYAAKAGGDVDAWRDIMRDEQWFKASEAVDAGLADEYADAVSADSASARMSFDLSRFAYAYTGRDAAPPPKTPPRPPAPAQTPQAPAASGASSCPPTAAMSAAEAIRRVHAATKTTASDQAAAPQQEGAGLMDPAKIREGFGLAPDASDDEVRAAIMSAGLVSTPAPAAPAAGATDEQPQTPVASGTPVTAMGDAVVLDPAQYSALRQAAMRGEDAWRKLRENECDAVLDAAVKAGKFPPSRREHWKTMWAADPEGTKQFVEKLQPNVIPVMNSGYAGVSDATETDMVYAAMYPDAIGGDNRGR